MNGDFMIELSGNKTVAINEAAVLELLPDLAFIRFYDAAPRGRANFVDPVDWAIPSLLSAPIRSALENIDDDYLGMVNADLAQCRVGWRLQDEDVARGRREAVRTLLNDMCSISGVKRAIATKILHKKRPNLIPIIDSVVLDFYANNNKASTTDVIFDELRHDLIENATALKWLSDQANESSPSMVLTPLRLLEMIVWLQAKKGGNYRSIRLSE